MINNSQFNYILSCLNFKNITISTWFTILRIVLIPFIVSSIVFANWDQALLLFLVAGFTDLIDGFLARYLNQESLLGAVLDPLADKLLMVSCYTALIFFGSEYCKMPIWFALIISFKEILLVLGAIVLGVFKKSIVVKPTMLGKLTTTIQIFFILWVFVCSYFRIFYPTIFHILLILISLLNIIVLFQYSFIAFRNLNL